MEARRPVIWEILQEEMTPGTWYHLHDLYDVVEARIDFDDHDLEPPAEYASGDTNWQKQVRSTLQYRKQTGEIDWNENEEYRLLDDDQSPPTQRSPHRSEVAAAMGGDRGLWAFCSNPEVYDVVRAVRERRRGLWTTGHSDVQRGDLALVWKTKGGTGRRGVVSFALVLEDPEPRPAPADRFWQDSKETREDQPRAPVRYVTPDECPLWESQCVFLSDLNVARARGGTVFHVAPEEWARVVGTLEDPADRDWLTPNATEPGDDWTPIERELLVWDYMQMLALELEEEPYSKTDRRRALSDALPARSDGSIEYKHQNVSYVLHRRGLPIIDGYKPAENRQKALVPHVLAAYDDVVGDSPPRKSTVGRGDQDGPGDIAGARVEPPVRIGTPEKTPDFSPTDWDPEAAESRRREVGSDGEEWVAAYERDRLEEAGCPGLADRVEVVSKTRGDGLGYDVRSFDLQGNERFLEVKSTVGGPSRAFHLTRRELQRSRVDPEKYRIYRVFDLHDDPRFFVLEPPLEDVCTLVPLEYRVASIE